jgi:hypothetical protein
LLPENEETKIFFSFLGNENKSRFEAIFFRQPVHSTVTKPVILLMADAGSYLKLEMSSGVS